ARGGPGRGVHDVPVGIAPAGEAADGFPAPAPVGRPPRAVPSEGPGGDAGRPPAARVDSPNARAYNRCELFRHGGRATVAGGQLCPLPGGGPAAPARVAPAARPDRLDRVRPVPDADGRGERQTHLAPGSVPGPGLRRDAGSGPAAARANPRNGVEMTLTV